MSSSDSSEYAIEVTGLGKCYQIYEKPRDRLKQMLMRGRRQYYKEFWALKDVSFKIKKGQTIGIVGRNGSGKSTLLQLICGTLNPTAGQIKVSGRIAALLELGAGFNGEFTGKENVYMNARILGLNDLEIDSRFEDIVAFADIGEYIDQPVKTYSSGMYVRLAFAVIAHVDAKILIIDEALAVGDALFTQKCMRFLRTFQQTGTILFVSHDIGSVLSLCQRAFWLDKGRLSLQGSSKEIAEAYIENTYGSTKAPEPLSNPDLTQDERPTEVISATQSGFYDMRLDFLNHSKYRNDIEVFSFGGGQSAFGNKGITIENVQLKDCYNQTLSWLVGGEIINLSVLCLARQIIHSPIVGFYIKDRLGQILFGDNTFLSTIDNPISLLSGEMFTAVFQFRMPILPVGDYSVTVAVAEGTQNEHVQHHWIHDALFVRSITSSVTTGLIGLPMQNIELLRQVKKE
jgi:lipopolysaccharide transport system ATP-binding protein